MRKRLLMGAKNAPVVNGFLASAGLVRGDGWVRDFKCPGCPSRIVHDATMNVYRHVVSPPCELYLASKDENNKLTLDFLNTMREATDVQTGATR